MYERAPTASRVTWGSNNAACNSASKTEVENPFEVADSARLLGPSTAQVLALIAQALVPLRMTKLGCDSSLNFPRTKTINNQESTISNSFSLASLVRGEMNFPWQSG
jgi:hypothetical protein